MHHANNLIVRASVYRARSARAPGFASSWRSREQPHRASLCLPCRSARAPGFASSWRSREQPHRASLCLPCRPARAPGFASSWRSREQPHRASLCLPCRSARAPGFASSWRSREQPHRASLCLPCRSARAPGFASSWRSREEISAVFFWHPAVRSSLSVDVGQIGARDPGHDGAAYSHFADRRGGRWRHGRRRSRLLGSGRRRSSVCPSPSHPYGGLRDGSRTMGQGAKERSAMPVKPV